MTDRDLATASHHLIYELNFLARFYVRAIQYNKTGPGELRVACLEATLVHARILIEFLTGRPKRKDRWHDNDIKPLDFVSTWTPPKVILDSYLQDIDKHLAHLTWTRTDRALPKTWPFEHMVRRVVVEFGNFVAATQREGSPFAERFDASMKSAWDLMEKATPRSHPADLILTTSGADKPLVTVQDFRSCTVCGQMYTFSRHNSAPTAMSTRGGPFGITKQVHTVGGVVVHECPRLPDLVRAGRSLRDELLVRGRDGPVDPAAVLRDARLRGRDADGYVTMGLVVDVLQHGLMTTTDGAPGEAWTVPLGRVVEHADRFPLLRLTEVGEGEARAILDREEEECETAEGESGT